MVRSTNLHNLNINTNVLEWLAFIKRHDVLNMNLKNLFSSLFTLIVYVVKRADDCFLSYHLVTMSVPVLLLAIFIWFGLVLYAYPGTTFLMLCACKINFADYITPIHELCHCLNKTRNKKKYSVEILQFNFAICHSILR